jgi:hypothetical protein
MTHGTKWTDQWARIERWQRRVEEARDTWSEAGTEERRDDLLALFESIWHLKNWIINDDSAAEANSRECARGSTKA